MPTGALSTISAVIPAGQHLFPFRTEKLSLPGPMVLGGQPPGRVGRRRINFAEPVPEARALFVLAPADAHAHSARVSGQASFEDAECFALDLERSCVAAFEESLAGVILHGSLTLGGYIRGRSDVDLLAIVDDPVTDAQLTALTTAANARQPRKRIRADLRVVLRHEAAEPTPLPRMEAYIHIGLSGLQAERRHPGERDLLVELSICRAHGRSLCGAEPAELIGAVPAAWVLDVGDAQLADWQAIGDDPEHAELTVLTACRIWRFAEEDCHCSKTAAGEWALARDGTLQAVRAALHQRHVGATGAIDAAEIRRLLAVVRARVADVRAGRD